MSGRDNRASGRGAELRARRGRADTEQRETRGQMREEQGREPADNVTLDCASLKGPRPLALRYQTGLVELLALLARRLAAHPRPAMLRLDLCAHPGNCHGRDGPDDAVADTPASLCSRARPWP